MFPGNFRFRGGKENFRVATASRKYPLQVEDVTFFVNPYALSQVSPVFEVMALDQGFVENKNLKACIEEESPEDIEIFLEAICPTYYGVYPDTVKEETFPILARLADKFLVDGLRCGCEEFILRCRLNKQSPNSLLRMLITCCSFNLKDRLKKLLLKHLLKVKDQNVVIDEDLKQHPIGELVCHELTGAAQDALQHCAHVVLIRYARKASILALITFTQKSKN
uniref:BTB domain-containing protein n=1 Tax=Syphacia muris TaxID=451379 RepID=A0A0N5AXT7_9BILA